MVVSFHLENIYKFPFIKCILRKNPKKQKKTAQGNQNESYEFSSKI